MRELKFRAWDKKYKKMYEADIRVALAFPSEDIDIMQFTGLHDKNGKEIYEGDIVRHIGPDLTEPLHRPLATTILEVKANPKYGYRMFAGIHERLWEIAGNIYENPELLQGGKP